MLKLTQQDTEQVSERLIQSKRPLEELLSEVKEDQGEEYVAQMALVGLSDIGYLYGMLAMYFSIKNAMIRFECEDLDKLFKRGGKA